MRCQVYLVAHGPTDDRTGSDISQNILLLFGSNNVHIISGLISTWHIKEFDILCNSIICHLRACFAVVEPRFILDFSFGQNSGWQGSSLVSADVADGLRCMRLLDHAGALLGLKVGLILLDHGFCLHYFLSVNFVVGFLEGHAVDRVWERFARLHRREGFFLG